MEERVELLERLLSQQGQAEGSSTELQVARPQDTSTSSTNFTTRGEDEQDETSDLVSQAGVLSLHATGAEPHYFGPSSIFSFSRVIHAYIRQAVRKEPNNETDSLFEDADASSISPCRLPNYEIGTALSNAYFSNVHLQYPFLHEPTFRKWEKNVYEIDSAVASSTELFFVNMASIMFGLLLEVPADRS